MRVPPSGSAQLSRIGGARRARVGGNAVHECASAESRRCPVHDALVAVRNASGATPVHAFGWGHVRVGCPCQLLHAAFHAATGLRLAGSNCPVRQGLGHGRPKWAHRTFLRSCVKIARYCMRRLKQRTCQSTHTAGKRGGAEAREREGVRTGAQRMCCCCAMRSHCAATRRWCRMRSCCRWWRPSC